MECAKQSGLRVWLPIDIESDTDTLPESKLHLMGGSDNTRSRLRTDPVQHLQPRQTCPCRSSDGQVTSPLDRRQAKPAFCCLLQALNRHPVQLFGDSLAANQLI